MIFSPRTIATRLRADVDLTEILSAASWSFGLKLVGVAVGYLFALLVSRQYGAQGWGVFAIWFTFLSLVTIISRLGLDVGLMKYCSQKAGQQKSILRSAYRKAGSLILLTSLSLSVLTFFSAEMIAGTVLGKPHLTPVFWIASVVIVPLAITYLNTQALRSLKKIREYIFFDIVAKHLVALIVLLVLMNAIILPFSWIIAYAISIWLTAIASFMCLAPYLKRYPGPPVVVDGKALLMASLPLLMTSSMVFLKGWMDTIMLGLMVDEAEVGIYNIALKLATLVTLPLLAVNSIAAPKFAEAYGAGDTRKLSKIAAQASRLLVLTAVPIFCLIWWFAESALGFFGSEYASETTTLRTLALAHLISALCGSVGYLLQMTNRQVVYQNVTLCVVVAGFLSNYVLIGLFGIWGAALSTLLTLSALNLFCVVYARKKLNILTVYVPFGRKMAGL